MEKKQRCNFHNGTQNCPLNAEEGDRFCLFHSQIPPSEKKIDEFLRSATNAYPAPMQMSHIRISGINTHLRLDFLDFLNSCLESVQIHDSFISSCFSLSLIADSIFEVCAWDRNTITQTGIEQCQFKKCSFINLEADNCHFSHNEELSSKFRAENTKFFAECNFKDAVFARTGFTNLLFYNCLFDRTIFIDCSFRGCVFQNCRFYDCEFHGQEGLKKTDLKNCQTDLKTRTSLNS
jgi:uncharacterized protein YjbI with pentapeptide repeats